MGVYTATIAETGLIFLSTNLLFENVSMVCARGVGHSRSQQKFSEKFDLKFPLAIRILEVHILKSKTY